MATWSVEQAELVEWLTKYDGPRFHAIVSDPPYALISIAKRFGKSDSAPAQEGSDGRFSRLSGGFMGQKWDGFESLDQYRAWVEAWARLLIEKALEPGAVCMFFGGTRTFHHLALGLEQGGFEVYDTFMYLYGSGFPKSHRISKGILDLFCEASLQGGLRSLDKDVSSLDDCPSHCRLCGGSLHPVLVAGPHEWPLSTDVQEHNRLSWPSIEIPLDNEHRSMVSCDALSFHHAKQGFPALETWRTIVGASRASIAERTFRTWLDDRKDRFAIVQKALDLWPLQNNDENNSYADNVSREIDVSETIDHTNRKSVVTLELDALLYFSMQCNHCATHLGQAVLDWFGHGTSAKPAWEPILFCRAPRGKHTFAELATEHGSGALNIDGARISHNEPEEIMEPREPQFGKTTYANAQPSEEREGEELASPSPLGRWPANLILSHHEDCQKIGEELRPAETLQPLGQVTSRLGTLAGGMGSDAPRKKHTRVKARVINRFESGMKPFGNAAGEKYETVKPMKARLPDGSANPDYKQPDEESPWKMPLGKRRPTKVRIKASGGTAAHSEPGKVYGGGEGMPLIERKNYADEEGYELVDRWACVPECPVRQLDDSIREGLGRSSMGGGTTQTIEAELEEQVVGFTNSPIGYRSPQYYDSGGPSRFFYTGKATRGEKDIGLDDFYWKRTEDGFERVTKTEYNKLPRRERAHANIHPTCKPVELIRYLATLVLPPKRDTIIRRMLVPFSGSGSEIIGAIQAGWDEVVGVEMGSQYNDMARARLRGTIGMF